MLFRFKGTGDNPSPHFHTFKLDDDKTETRPLVVGETVESDVDLAANHPDRFERLDGQPSAFVPPPAPTAAPVTPMPPFAAEDKPKAAPKADK